MVLECTVDASYGLRKKRTPINMGFITCVACLGVTCIGIILILKIV